MNYQDYNEVVNDFKCLKRFDNTAEFYVSHFNAISKFISELDNLRKCFEKHSENNDYFPSHIDLKNALNLINGDNSRKQYMSEKTPIDDNQLRIRESEDTNGGKRINSMSDSAWFLHSRLTNKQIVLVVCEKGSAKYLKCEAEILELKYLIKRQEEIEQSLLGSIK